MSITIAHLRDQLDAYLERWPGDAAGIAPLLALDSPAGFARATMPGHVTASAIVLNASGEVLLIHHKAIGRWFQPGGHLDPADPTLPAAARREAAEETGIAPADLHLADPAPIHIDIHPIPANPRKHEGPHHHYDIRYAFHTPAATLDPDTTEVLAAEWRPPTDLDNPALVKRVQALQR